MEKQHEVYLSQTVESSMVRDHNVLCPIFNTLTVLADITLLFFVSFAYQLVICCPSYCSFMLFFFLFDKYDQSFLVARRRRGDDLSEDSWNEFNAN